MKTTILLIFLVFLGSLIPGYLVYTDECPPGWTLAYVEGFLDPMQPWCYYWVEYCFYCDNVNKKVLKEVVGIWSYTRCVVPKSRWEPFKQRILEKVAIDAIKKCFGDNIPPCDPPPPPNYTVEVRLSECWYHENLWFNKFTGSDEWLWVMRPCGTNKCLYTYQLCIDYSLSPPDVVLIYENCEPLGVSNCTTQEPDIPPPGKTWDEAWKTECFARPCCP